MHETRVRSVVEGLLRTAVCQSLYSAAKYGIYVALSSRRRRERGPLRRDVSLTVVRLSALRELAGLGCAKPYRSSPSGRVAEHLPENCDKTGKENRNKHSLPKYLALSFLAWNEPGASHVPVGRATGSVLNRVPSVPLLESSRRSRMRAWSISTPSSKLD